MTNALQVVALAWIAMKQVQVKRELNGSDRDLSRRLHELDAALDELRTSQQMSRS